MASTPTLILKTSSGAELNEEAAAEEATLVEDERFDRVYPQRVRDLSSVFWTPVAVAADAAKLLVTSPGTRVLDLGCGAGKFCLFGAMSTAGHFTGVEQRGDLVAIATKAAADLQLSAVQFLHANVADVSFAVYDAFYLFNPFEENMLQGHKIDSAVPLSPELFRAYTCHVARELSRRPLGTRVVSYMGYADEIPDCYSCEATLFRDDLKLWIKNREPDPMLDQLNLRPSRSYHGSLGWSGPRH